MSSYFCGDECFSSLARIGMQCRVSNHTFEMLNAMVRETAELNLLALSQRYDDYRETTEQYQSLLRAIQKMHYQDSDRTPVQDVLSAHGWLYQCSEGTVPSMRSYRNWEGMIHWETLFYANIIKSPLQADFYDQEKALSFLRKYCERIGLEDPWGR